jgi:hypothetical protein
MGISIGKLTKISRKLRTHFSKDAGKITRTKRKVLSENYSPEILRRHFSDEAEKSPENYVLIYPT